MTEEKKDGEEKEEPQSEGRRDFLKGMVGVSTIVLLASLVDFGKVFEPITVKIPEWPKIKVKNASSLQVNAPVSFAYPLTTTPNLLVKLGQKVPNGVGPDGDIVAFSVVCQHLGCIVGYQEAGSSPSCNSSFKASGPVCYCCCHAGIYDLANEAKVLAGPPPNPLPFVVLEYDDSTGDIYATGMTSPAIFGKGVFGKGVDGDLLGGTVVSS